VFVIGSSLGRAASGEALLDAAHGSGSCQCVPIVPPLLELHALRVDGPDGPLLAPIDLQVARGSVVAVCGPNGAGKSTLLKALLGLRPHAGRVCLGGRDTATMDGRERARRAAYVPQTAAGRGLGLRVVEVVAQGRFAHRPVLANASDADRAVIAATLERCGLTPLAQRWAHTLSGGEFARVLLARALATEAPLLVLDEPTAALDLAQTARFLALVRAHADAGGAAIMAIHDLDLAADHADRLLLLRAGQVLAHDTAAAVLTPDHLAAAYGCAVARRPAWRAAAPA
jgi:iron complex transport system ATP-binding protein